MPRERQLSQNEPGLFEAGASAAATAHVSRFTIMIHTLQTTSMCIGRDAERLIGKPCCLLLEVLAYDSAGREI